MRTLILVSIILLGARPARAEAGDDEARARSHFEIGRGHYRLGNFSDAIDQFSAGYALVPRPEFLLNLGQAYRKLGNLAKAREMYAKFIAEAPIDNPDRRQVLELMAEIDRDLGARTVEPAAAAVQIVTSPPPIEVGRAPEETGRARGRQRLWWLTVPAVALVAAAVAVGVYVATRPQAPDCTAATFGCLDAR